jgi:hypothetical protein
VRSIDLERKRKKKFKLGETLYPFLYNDLRLSACRSADKERGTSPLKAVRSIVPMTGEHEEPRRNINEEKRAVSTKSYVSQRISQTFTPFYFYGISYVWQGYYITAVQMES